MESIFDRLDADQLAAVRLRKNGAVSAGAGSGKTTVLAARYLDLVLRSGAEVSSILCLTFTRKAAAEMRSRVWRELSLHGTPRSDEQAARFSEASIQTIDAFCGLVLRSSAQLYGYPPDFRVDDEATRELVEAEALRFLLARRERPELAKVLAMMGFERAWKELFAAVANRYSSPAPRAEDDLGAVPGRARASLIRIARDALSAIGREREVALSLGASSSKAGSEAFARFSALPAQLPVTVPGPASSLTVPGPAPSLTVPGPEADQKALEAWLGDIEAHTRPLAELKLSFGRNEEELARKEATRVARDAARQIASCLDAAIQRPLEDAVIGDLAVFVEEVSQVKRRAGLMGFRDVAVAAVDLLTRHPELRAWWKSRFRYIMVDEFQDDDELQKELLYLLAEDPARHEVTFPAAKDLAPDKLFFVGDDKQSIFRFRGADVSVFNRLSRELGEGRPEGPESEPGGSAPKLRTNYRSEPGLIEYFNELFARLLASPGAADYEARHEAALARKPNEGVAASVALLWKPRRRTGGSDDEYRSDDEALAEGTVLHLKDLIEKKGIAVPDGSGGSRRAEWDDVAILFRSTSKQYVMERFLRLHDIPYSAASVRSLFVESPAYDLFALLRLALLPDDRPSWAGLLRSPFVGLDDEAFVEVLASERGPFDGYDDLDLSAKDLMRLAKARELLEDLRERIDREPLAEVVAWIWYEGGQRLSILRDPANHAFLEHFDYLFALAAAADAKGENLARFLDRLGPSLGTPEKLDEGMEVPREAARGLRLMTVHRSKGLEFPIVVIPWIESGGRKEGQGPAWYESKEAGLTLNLLPWDDPAAKRRNVFYENAKTLEEAQALAELKRLFYVACTRASAHLVFAGIEPRRKTPESSFLAFLGGLSGPEGLSPPIPLTALPELSEEGYKRLVGHRRGRDLGAFETAYRDAKLLDRSRLPRIISATVLADLAWARDPRRLLPAPALPDSVYDSFSSAVPENLFGELCHAVIETRLGGQSLPSDHPVLRALPDEIRPLLLAEAERLSEGFFSSELGRLVSSATEARTEKALLLSLGSLVVRCRLDLMMRVGDEILIVDWKSGRERRGAEYATQMSLYRKVVGAAHPGARVRSFVFWLRSGEAEELDEEDAEGSLLEAAREAFLAQEGTRSDPRIETEAASWRR